MSAIRLIVGLGNPGPRFAETRHNVGAAFVHSLAARYDVPLSEDKRFKGFTGRGDVAGRDVRLAVPTTYMNLSGECVGALVRFYKLAPDELLVAHDEMAFEPGVVKLKVGGGDNGHNGLRDIVGALGNEGGFVRLRIGVGHPGDRSTVTPWLTQIRMPADVRESITLATTVSEEVLAALLTGEVSRAMNLLHAPKPTPEND